MTNFKIYTVKITNITDECEGTKTFTFKLNRENSEDFISPKPGQFIMVWVPGVDEVPMSISSYEGDGSWSFCVKNVGECTNSLHNLKIGDYIGVRGPLGTWFEYPKEKFQKIFLIGGGIGMAPIRFLAYELFKEEIPFVLIQGAKVKNELLFMNDLNSYKNKDNFIYYCTDDGSEGLKGFANEAFEKILENYSEKQLSNAIAYTCGPELMMYKIFQICEKFNIEIQASLERIMRCGCGLCGLCSMDPLGFLVCKDGPVFNSLNLRNLSDFGKFKRNFTGKKIGLE
ncbi:MAG: dihydroorotate dehydrogenase electron transfer subunit [Promethearchaeota archaeon]